MKVNSNRRQRGASILEMLAVVGIVLTTSAFAIMSGVRPSTTTRANTATDEVVTTLIQARQLAISKRRNVQVAFNTPKANEITVTLLTLPNEAAPLPIPVVKLNDGISTALQFYVFPTIPNTPMGPLGFGNTTAIDLQAVNGGTPAAVMFSTSGGFVGDGGVPAANYYAVGNNDPVNASIFIGTPGTNSTARAITVLGATGRVRSYYWNGTAWQE
jgi:type II secretory pathway pseudopilin PulG